MQQYKKANLITGWIIFLIASAVYLLTIEPTTSLWDCGEFIASAVKLEIGHPPGAPFFMLVGRFFSLFTGDPQNQAMLVNAMSGLSSSFTVLFLFWSITHISRKIILRDGETYNLSNNIAIIGSGIIGALAYTFTDSFWFSAVEGEVYAMSSLFTAIVFWAILKWENEADQKHSARWLILIALLMGISIGVHLLNLLTIPALVLVYYFRKFNHSRKGFIYALLVGFGVLGIVHYLIIPGVVNLGSKFELFFVNGLGLPFNTGVFFYIALLVGLVIFGIYYTHKKRLILYNNIVLILTMILIGYSAFAMIVIRSAADPPMDENDPENFFALKSYINRDQYGDRPLVTGPFFNAPVVNVEEGGATYVQENGKYVVSKRKRIPQYDDQFTTFFPRMYSTRGDHVQRYKQWVDIDGEQIRVKDRRGQMKNLTKPSFGDNLEFFFKYQLGYMYFRYFMWNFSGRQNDNQGFGGTLDGNWITGLEFIDKHKIGNQKIPDHRKNHPSRNAYYLLPFILGIIGIVYQASKDKKSFSIVLLLFFLTGIAIILYLNQPPVEPRERDYTYAGSFYTFSIWIGISVLALFDAAKRLKKKTATQGALYLGGLALAAYLFESMGTNEHTFSGMILWTGIVGAVLVGVMFLLGKVNKNRPLHAIIATLLLVPVPVLMGIENWEDHDRSGKYTARDMAYNYLNSCEPNAILFTNGDNDTFPLWYIQEVEGVRTDVRVINLMLLNTDWHIKQAMRKAYDSERLPISLPLKKYREGTNDVVYIHKKPSTDKYYSVKQLVDFVKSDQPGTKIRTNSGERDYLPTSKFILNVDSATIMQNNVVSPAIADQILPKIRWNIGNNKNYVSKSEMVMLDILADNNWERPIYFVSPTRSNSLGLNDYLQLEGYAYRLIPVKSSSDQFQGTGRIDTDILYNNLMNEFKWGRMNEEDVYLGHFDRRTLRVVRLRHKFHRLADALIREGKNDSAMKVVDKCIEILPHHALSYDYFSSLLAEDYYRLGANEKAEDIIRIIAEMEEDDLNYYARLMEEGKNNLQQEIRQTTGVLRSLASMTNEYGNNELSTEIQNIMKKQDLLQRQGQGQRPVQRRRR